MCELLMRQVTTDGLKLHERCVQKDQADKLRALRSSIAAFGASVRGLADGELALRPHSELRELHDPTLDGLFDFAALAQSLAFEARRVENRFATLWPADMDMVAKTIEEACPQWAHVKDELLDHPCVVQALVGNVGQHYNSIGPLCN